MNAKTLAWFALALFAGEAGAQFRPPAFIGGLPGMAQFQAVQMQRHQARTLLYREALEELRKNPAAADVPDCEPGQLPKETLCLARPVAPQPLAEQASVVPAPVAPAPVAQAPAADTSVPTVAKSAPSALPVAPVASRRIALLFGNNDYKPPIPELETPIADVEVIASALRTRFGYDVRIVRNASKAGIVESVNGIAGEARSDDSVLLFYAGHGYLMEDISMGFWIPIDGSVKTASNWISNADISKLLSAIPARQLILISDSCFSGSLTREQKITGKGALAAEDVLRRRSVVVFSSGGDEPVSDEGKEGHSIFAWSLIKTLNEISTTTAGHDVWRLVRGTVTKDYSQEPQYGAVLSAGHVEGGEYLFQLR